MEDKKIVTLPRMGKYVGIFKFIFEELGCEVIVPKPTREYLHLGISCSPEMMCIPFKFNLANYRQVLDENPDKEIALIQYRSCGMCRFHTYYITQQYILESLGYKFKGIYTLSWKTFVRDVKRITHASTLKILKVLWQTYKKIREMDFQIDRVGGKIKIGIMGEIFTCVDEECNLHIEDKLKSLGCLVINKMSLSNFIKHGKASIVLDRPFRRLKKEVMEKCFPERLGGHGIDSIASMLYFIRSGFDGVVFIRPLTCAPEVAVEPVIKHLSKEHKLPVLILDFDENDSTTNLENRVESYIESIRLKNETRSRLR